MSPLDVDWLQLIAATPTASTTKLRRQPGDGILTKYRV